MRKLNLKTTNIRRTKFILLYSPKGKLEATEGTKTVSIIRIFFDQASWNM